MCCTAKNALGVWGYLLLVFATTYGYTYLLEYISRLPILFIEV